MGHPCQREVRGERRGQTGRGSVGKTRDHLCHSPSAGSRHLHRVACGSSCGHSISTQPQFGNSWTRNCRGSVSPRAVASSACPHALWHTISVAAVASSADGLTATASHRRSSVHEAAARRQRSTTGRWPSTVKLRASAFQAAYAAGNNAFSSFFCRPSHECRSISRSAATTVGVGSGAASFKISRVCRALANGEHRTREIVTSSS